MKSIQNVQNIAVVGCGYWGKNLVRNMAQLGVLACVCDSNASNAQAQASLYSVPVKSFEEVLADPSIVGVVIAAPAILHAPLAERALSAGKHVFVEKPLALTVADGARLVELSHKVGRVLMVGHLMHYHPAYLALKSMITEGKLGALRYVYSHRLNLGKVRTEENVMWSFAPHDLSMILGLVQSPLKTTSAQHMACITDRVADIATAQYEFESGVRAHVFVSWLNPVKSQQLVAVGESGMAVFDDGLPWETKLMFYPHRIDLNNGFPTAVKGDGTPVPLTPAEPLQEECRHFLSAVNGTHPARTDGCEGLRVLSLLEASEKAAGQEKPMKEQPEAKPYYVHETALIDDECTIGEGSKIWHFSHILKGTSIGTDVVIGQNVMIGPEVVVGQGCKIQNNVSLYKGVTLEEGVFCGPSCVFTNVNTPRARVERKDAFLPTHVGKWATIGANATIVCGNDIGAYALIGAGSVVTKNVKPHALMVGNPAKQIGWVSHAGERLESDLVCPREGRRYRINNRQELEEITGEENGAGNRESNAA